MNKLIVFFYILILINDSSNKILHFNISTYDEQITDIRRLQLFNNKIPILRSSNLRVLINGCFGNPPQCSKMKLSTSNSFTWVADSSINEEGFDSTKSNSFSELHRELIIKEKKSFIQGVVVADTFSLGDYKVNYFPFILSHSKEEFYEEYTGALGLAYQYTQPEYSFLAQLYEENLISEESFYVKYSKKEEKGDIYFGGIPDEDTREIKKKKYKMKTCPLLATKNERDLNNRWECEVKGIYMFFQFTEEPLYILINDRVSFNLSSNINLVPTRIFDIFVNFYLKDYFDTEKCRLIHIGYFHTIQCDSDLEPQYLGSINYIIGKYTIKFKGEDLFRYNAGSFTSTIAKHSSLDTFVFGYDFFDKFNVYFNKKEQYVGWVAKDF